MSLLQAMLRDLPLSAGELERLIRTAPHRYKVYSIPKRSQKGERVIAQPAAEVKILQRWLVERVLRDYPVHDAAVAYRPGIGIKDNAEMHVRNSFLLKLDFKDFFPSIKGVHFAAHTKKYAPQYANELSMLISVLFWAPKGTGDRVLSIGAPSSPSVSNSIAYDFDVEMAEFAATRNIVYTRYADDLLFSTSSPNVLKDVRERVERLCKSLEYPKLRVNDEKTVYASRRGNRTATGLVLANDGRVSIGWRNKRAVRNLIHRLEYGRLDEEKIGWLRGYLSFVRDVEPDLFFKLKGRMGEKSRKALLDE